MAILYARADFAFQDYFDHAAKIVEQGRFSLKIEVCKTICPLKNLGKILDYLTFAAIFNKRYKTIISDERKRHKK